MHFPIALGTTLPNAILRTSIKRINNNELL
jgi:hypothetical protein